jgi:hypothetical protein
LEDLQGLGRGDQRCFRFSWFRPRGGGRWP